MAYRNGDTYFSKKDSLMLYSSYNSVFYNALTFDKNNIVIGDSETGKY